MGSVQFSCSVMSNSLWPYGLQHARLLCPSPTHHPHHELISWDISPLNRCEPLSNSAICFDVLLVAPNSICTTVFELSCQPLLEECSEGVITFPVSYLGSSFVPPPDPHSIWAFSISTLSPEPVSVCVCLTDCWENRVIVMLYNWHLL